MNVKEMLTIGTFFLCVSCTSNIDLGSHCGAGYHK